MMMQFIKFALCLLLAGNISAREIEFNWLGSTTGHKSSLSGKCESLKDNGSMRCNLRQISFRKALNIEAAQQETSKILEDIDGELQGRSVREWVKENIQCQELLKARERFDEATSFEWVKVLCEDPTRERLAKFMENSIYKKTKTCKVNEVDVGDFVFEKVSKNKWVSNNGPKGLCSVVVLMTLEQEPGHDNLWSFSQTKQYMNLEPQLCQSLASVVEPMRNSWKAPEAIKADCEYIEFGLF